MSFLSKLIGIGAVAAAGAAALKVAQKYEENKAQEDVFDAAGADVPPEGRAPRRESGLEIVLIAVADGA